MIDGEVITKQQQNKNTVAHSETHLSTGGDNDWLSLRVASQRFEPASPSQSEGFEPAAVHRTEQD
jgi:hypothetical protein